VLEVEVGVVGGEEDGVRGPEGPRSQLYTTTADLLRTADVLGTGERGRYLLAATFGNVHGVYAPGHVDLRPAILRDGQEALASAHPGARFAYVFHGSSGSPADKVREAIAAGVVKINLDTDAQYAFTRAIADHIFTNYDGALKVDGGIGRKGAYDPRAWGAKAESALAAHIAAVASSSDQQDKAFSQDAAARRQFRFGRTGAVARGAAKERMPRVPALARFNAAGEAAPTQAAARLAAHRLPRERAISAECGAAGQTRPSRALRGGHAGPRGKPGPPRWRARPRACGSAR
jgi:hypothetical protein